MGEKMIEDLVDLWIARKGNIKHRVGEEINKFNKFLRDIEDEWDIDIKLDIQTLTTLGRGVEESVELKDICL